MPERPSTKATTARPKGSTPSKNNHNEEPKVASPPDPPKTEETPTEAEVPRENNEEGGGAKEEEVEEMTVEKKAEGNDASGAVVEDEEEEEEDVILGEFEDGSIRASAPAPTPQLEDMSEDDLRPMGMNELKAALGHAIGRLTSMSATEFLISLRSKSDIHAHALLSAKQISKEFVEKAADVAAAMQLILQYDQLMLRKLNLTTAYDFGVKPRTAEETRAIMIDRAQRMLKLGQMQYDISHQISDTAKPLTDYRFEACDEFNAVQDKIYTIKEIEADRAKRLADDAEAAAQLALSQPLPQPPESAENVAEGASPAAGPPPPVPPGSTPAGEGVTAAKLEAPHTAANAPAAAEKHL